MQCRALLHVLTPPYLPLDIVVLCVVRDVADLPGLVLAKPESPVTSVVDSVVRENSVLALSQ